MPLIKCEAGTDVIVTRFADGLIVIAASRTSTGIHHDPVVTADEARRLAAELVREADRIDPPPTQ